MVTLIHKSGKSYPLEDHQLTAFDWLMARDRSALFMEMSLGKTIVSLLYLHYMHYEDCAVLKSLVIAPDKVARITWPNEMADWHNFDGMRYSIVVGTAEQRVAALEADAEIFIVSVNNLAWLVDHYIKEPRKYKYVGTLPFDLVLIDELSTLKSRGGVTFKKAERALRLSAIRYRIGLTGTPISNGYIDLWAQMLLIDSGQRLGAKFGEYLDKYFTTRGNGQIVYEYTPKQGAAKTISHKISDIALTMKTRDYMELPECFEIDEVLDFDGFDRDTYDTLEREYCLEFFNYEHARKHAIPPDAVVTVKTSADLNNKLVQISSGALYADKEAEEARQWYEVNTVKIDKLRDLLNINHEPVIVVYQYQHEVDRIKAAFPNARTLRNGKHLHEDFRAWNAGEISLLLIHPKSAGHGLNLQYGGRRMIWFSPTYNLDYLMQTIARLVRRGALKEFYIHFLLVRGTRDLKVRKSNHLKQGAQDFLYAETKELREKYYGKLR